MAVATRVRRAALRPNWRYRLRQWAWAGVDLVLPPVCGGCGALGKRLCAGCQAALQRLPARVCQGCGYPFAGTQLCAACRAHPDLLAPLAGLRSAAFFEGPLQSAIHRLKYKRDVILGDTLAVELAEAWARYGLPRGWVVPVPLAADRLQQRGYNQAAWLGRGLAQLAGLAYLPAAVQRVRSTPAQVSLPAEARLANVRGAFRAAPRRVTGRSILLVDDVCTTGATLSACAEALLEAGAASVWGLTLARARLPRFMAAQARVGDERPLGRAASAPGSVAKEVE